jgi:DNA-binding NarL/FixJ family response regulator
MDTLLAIHSRDLRLAVDLLLREEPEVNVVGFVSETEGLMALIQTVCPNLILLDWGLPGRPLIDLLPKIQCGTPHPKIIVLGDRERYREPALAAGADAFVVKGESPQLLVAEIHQVNL